MEVEKLNKIADWILSLPKDEQFKISPLDFLKLANMLEKYKSEQLFIPRVSDSFIDEATALLKDYEQWEADIISEDKLWWPNTAKDVMRGHIYDTMMELQEKRNNLLKR